MMQGFSLGQFPNLLQNDKLLVKMPPLPQVRRELQWGLRQLTALSLTHSAKWVGELLGGLTTEANIRESFLVKSFITANTDDTRFFHHPPPTNQEDILFLARNLFLLREYQKCANLLKEHRSREQSCLFYYYYSLWMIGLIRKEEEIYENEGKNAVHSQIRTLDRELKKLHESGQLKGPNLYLYGLVLKEQERMKEARVVLVQCLNEMPLLWSAWVQLCKIIDHQDLIVITREMNDHWLKNFYFSSFCLERHRNDISIELNYGILCFFKTSTYVMNQIAHSFYNTQDYNVSLQWFQKLLQIDPFRYQNMDTYSNILYIKENQGELANLALKQFYNNKYNPQTCCVIGNYYSLMSQHLKALVYFRKALKLDRYCLAAWTLMGHQYLEMKNVPGATQAYRNAIEIENKDFRAWYGLGQAYQLQNMNHYAIYYYSRAVAARPNDSRMWNAMAACFNKMGKNIESKNCYQRSENSKDREGIAIHQLAKIYDAMGPEYQLKAVHAFEQNLKKKKDQNVRDKELAQCLLYLSKYYLKHGEKDKAIQLAQRLTDLQGYEKDQVNKLLQELNLLS